MPQLSACCLTAAALSALSFAAAGEPICGKRADILDSLARDYQEAPSAVGRSNGGSVVEVFTARHGKTWTILVTQPDGRSCVVAAGQQWTPVPQQLSSTDDGI